MKIIYLSIILGLTISCNSEKKKSQNSSITLETKVSENNKTQSGSESFKRGKEIYSNFCVTCHLPNGKGITGNFPPLAGSNWLVDKKEESLRAIKYGLNGPIEVNGEKYNNVMAAQGLSDEEVADVMNYISNSWGNKMKEEITINDIKNLN